MGLFLFFKDLEPGRRLRGRRAEEMKRKMGKTKRKDDRGMDVQVLLLMDPGAELGWAVLSDTLPSAGGEREYTSHQPTSHINNTSRHALVNHFS